MLGFGVVLDDCEEDIRIKLMLLLFYLIFELNVSLEIQGIIIKSKTQSPKEKMQKIMCIYIMKINFMIF